MKNIKLLFASFLICSIASAGSFNWQILGSSVAGIAGGTPSESTNTYRGQNLALFLFYSSDLAGVQTAINLMTTDKAKAISTIDDLSITKTTTSNTGAAGFPLEHPNDSGFVELFILIFDTSSITTAEYYMISSFKLSELYTGTVVPDVKGQFNSTDFGTVGAGAFGAVSPWEPFPVPIPEPATAGLALAGLALLFRRKRK